MNLNFSKDTIQISDRKVITGVISIAPVKGVFFPEENWNDSIVTILNSWLENMLLIWNGECTEAQFTFFDGPFSFKILKEKSGYTIELLQGSKRTGVFDMNFNDFAQKLILLSQEVREEAMAKGWESDDLHQLDRSLKKRLPTLI